MPNGVQNMHQTNKHACIHAHSVAQNGQHGMLKYSRYDSHKGGPILDFLEQELEVNLLSPQEQQIILKQIQNMF